MIANPRIGVDVRVHYNAKRAPTMPHHGKLARVVIASRGKPRNHGVLIDGRVVVVPCGNLVPFRRRG